MFDIMTSCVSEMPKVPFLRDWDFNGQWQRPVYKRNLVLENNRFT
jgi:hypothetical protein